MRPFLLGILGAALVGIAGVSAREIRKESGDLIVRVYDASGEARWPRLEIESRGAGQRVSLELDRTAVVQDVLLIGPNRIVVRGELGSRGDILTVIDADSGKIIDTLWGRNAAVSPDGRAVAYSFRIPPAIGQVRLSAALAAYDLTAPPALNTTPPGAKTGSPEERGVVLYPESNRVNQRFWMLLEQGDPDRGFVSPIAWSPDSRRLAVVEHEAEESRLVIVDISRGLRQPSIAVVPIIREVFLKPQFGVAIPSEHAADYVTFREVRFSEDDHTVVVTSWGVGAFAEKTATLAVPPASR